MNTAEKIAKRWVKAIEVMERYADKIHIIRYEDLIRAPEKEMVAVGQLLKVDPKNFSIDMIQDSSIGKYRQGLSKEQLATVIKVAGPTMARLGYS